MAPRTKEQQAVILEGAKSVKGIYFTMEKFAKDHNVAPLPSLRKKDVELEAYRKQALEHLNSLVIAEPVKVEKPKAMKSSATSSGASKVAVKNAKSVSVKAAA